MSFALALTITPAGLYCNGCTRCVDDFCGIWPQERDYNSNAYGEDEGDYYRVAECVEAGKGKIS